LVARRGTQRQAHFAHAEKTTCDGGLETILHRLAKELFRDISSLTVPEYRFHREHEIGSRERVAHNALILPSTAIPISVVWTERAVENVIPDITIASGTDEFFIEIVVTHPVDEDKLRTFRRLNRPVLEIRLPREDALLSREQLRTKLETDQRSKSWLFHPDQIEHEEMFCRLLSAAEARLAERQRANAAAFYLALTRVRQASTSHALKARRPKASERWESERFVEEHLRKTGRYPSLEECKAFEARRKKR
jgi:hypothetical protein